MRDNKIISITDLDISVKSKVVVYTRGWEYASFSYFTSDGIGAGVIEVKKTYNGTEAIAYGTPKVLNSTVLDLEAVDCKGVPGFILEVTTVRASAAQIQLLVYLSAPCGNAAYQGQPIMVAGA